MLLVPESVLLRAEMSCALVHWELTMEWMEPGKRMISIVLCHYNDVEVHTTRENGHATRCEVGRNCPSAVLLYHISGDVTSNAHYIVAGAWVQVRWQHGAWSEVDECLAKVCQYPIIIHITMLIP